MSAYGPIRVLRCFYLTIWRLMGKLCKTRWWVIAYAKLVFLILLHKPVFKNSRLFFIQLIFMYKVGKSPKHNRSELNVWRNRSGMQAVNRWLFNDCLKNTEGTHCSDSRRHREKFDNSSLISHVPILTFRHRYQSVPATTILLCTHVLCLSSFTRVVSSKLKNGS